VRAVFTFRNQGGAPATGVRVRFNLPEGLIYLVGSGRLDGNDIDDEQGNTPLLSRTGAHVGDVAPGEERRMEIAYSVAGAIENGTTVELQAALASFELPTIGSNVVRLVARSKPQLRNALTRITIETPGDPLPGSEAQITVRIHNAGESSARDIVAVAPIPEHSSYVAGSARINGRDLERDLGGSFDRVYAPVVLRSLAPNASATLSYRLRIDAPLPDGAQIVARAEIASQETAAFTLEAAALTIVASPNFSDDRTTFGAEPALETPPGARIALKLTAYNSGTAVAQRVTATIELDENLVPVRGASTVDGRLVREQRKEPLRFSLGPIDAGEQVMLTTYAVVASPVLNESVFTALAELEWEPARQTAARRLECKITVRSQPDFPPRRNVVERKGSGTVRPGATVEAAVLLANEGSAAANDAVLHLRIDPAFEEAAVFENSTRLNLEGVSGSLHADTLDLGTIDAQSTRRLTLRARVTSPCSDRSELRIGASLHTRELGETPLHAALWRVDSHPAFSPETSRLEFAEEPALRPNQLAHVDVVVANTGSDDAHNVRLRLYISPEARLESVDGAIRDKTSLCFGEIASGAQGRARLGLRLLRSLAKEYPVTLEAVLTADAMLPVPLSRLTIDTVAEPDFSIGSFRSEPAETVEVGETVEWILNVRNGGDGVAHHVSVAVEVPESLIYVPNSTTVNDVPVRDVGVCAPFVSAHGLVLNEVEPGVEAAIRWRSVAHSGLQAGTLIAQLARVRYDGERSDEFTSGELKVRSGPLFANEIPGLPFGLDGVLGPALAASPRALPEDRFMQLPPATPVGEGNGAPLRAQLSAGVVEEGFGLHVTGTMSALTPERISRTLRFLREARFGSLVTHLFALRAFLPDAIGDGYSSALSPVRDVLHEELDRLFIKLRLPKYSIAPRDVETPSLRSTFATLLLEASGARGVPAESPIAALELRGGFDPSELHDFAERLPSVELASALPWAALARFLPDAQPPYAEYRAQLIDALDPLIDSESSDFIDALQHQRDAALDAVLDAMCAALHATA